MRLAIKMNMCKKLRKDVLIINLLIPILVGGIAALLTKDSRNIYATIQTPSFAPPSILFPIVWTILYLLMGISSYLIYVSDNPKKEKALVIYGIQLALNFFWSILFFNQRAFLISFLWILLLLVTILTMIINFSKINKCAALIQIPYILWVSFAAVLNLSIYLLNK